MKSVTITYRPIGFLPLYRTKKGQFPQNWGEITAKQLTSIACLYKNRISDTVFLSRMSGISHRLFKHCSDYERYKLIECIEFIGGRKPFHEFIVRKITFDRYAANFFRETNLYSPEPKLKGVSFGQFIFADTYFSNYQESQKEDDLNKFIASLYLRRNEKFDEIFIQRNYRYVGKLDRNTREAIVINYQLIHEWLSLAYPLIFQKREEVLKQVQEDEPIKVRDDGTAWIKIFQNFVGDDVLNNDKWAEMPVNTIFQYMTRKYKENAQRK
jgi:hypothetical protein